MKITEVKGFPKELLKKKKLPLYKAYIFHDQGEEMKVNENAELLAITKEAAVQQLLKDIPKKAFDDHFAEIFNFDGNQNLFSGCLEVTESGPEDIKERLSKSSCERLTVTTEKDNSFKVNCKDAVVDFAVFKMDLDDLKDQDLVEGGMDYFENDIIGITLKGKLYKIDVESKALLSFKLSVSSSGNRIISNVKLKDVDK